MASIEGVEWEDDMYDEEARGRWLEDDDITALDEAFMRGWEEAFR